MESIIGQSLEAAAATIEQNSEEGAASIAGTVSNASPHVRHTKSLSVLAPSWRSSNDEHICQEADAMHEKISNDQFNIHLSRPTFSARVLPPRKQKGLYTSMTPPTSNVGTPEARDAKRKKIIDFISFHFISWIMTQSLSTTATRFAAHIAWLMTLMYWKLRCLWTVPFGKGFRRGLCTKMATRIK